MDKILDVVDDIKQNITDNQYKILMDSLMEIHNIHQYMKIIKIINSFVYINVWIQNYK